METKNVVPVKATREFNLVNHGLFKPNTLYFVSEELAATLVRRNLVEIQEIKEQEDKPVFPKKSKSSKIDVEEKN